MADDKKIGQGHQKINPKSLNNLKPAWVKGESPNPGGMPKDTGSIMHELKKKLTVEQARKIADNLLELATTKPDITNFTAVKLHQWAVDTVLDRACGKVPQSIENANQEPLRIEFINTIPSLKVPVTNGG